MRILFLLLALCACEEATVPIAERCDISLSALNPSEGPVGTTVIATVNPVTTDWDTIVHVGGAESQVQGVARTDCGECDSCRSEAACDSCEACESCDDVCRDRCIETVQFTVPAASPGVHATSLVNRHGHSNSLPFTVISAPDTGESDTSPPDTGDSSTDTGESKRP
jgi:hypothetical protein